jgi:hypothetical protein
MTGGLAGAPATNAMVPLIRSVVVTAVYGKMRLPNLEITLRRDNVYGKVITKGKTGSKGQVKLSGNWTDSEKICAGGIYRVGNRFLESWHCERPLPPTVTVDFKIRPPR